MNKIDAVKKLLKDMDQLQWYTPVRLKEIQKKKLNSLLGHHMKNNKWYKEFFKDPKNGPPILTRQDIISAGTNFFASEIPKEHGKIGIVKTSGSTGEPVVIQATDVTAMFFHTFNTQEVLWHRRDLKLRLAVTRAGQFENKEHPSWGGLIPSILDIETGPLLHVNIVTPIDAQLKLFEEFKPEILMVYPSTLSALLDAWKDNNNQPKLKHIKCIGETVSMKLRDRVKEQLGLKIEDSYSSQELGSIATQCPEGLYHTMDQNLIVEVLDDNNNPVAPGKEGRLVITDLHNYTSPMIRYEIGDWAVRGGPCKCGRGLLTLEKILGRTRNLIRHADGRRYWPMVGVYDFDKLDFSIRKYQVIQHSLTDIEYKIVTDNPLTADQEQALIDIARKLLGDDFNYRITRYDQPWPLKANGKFEEFVCLID